MADQPNNPENRQGVGPVDPNEVLADILSGVGPADSADPIYPELEGVDEEALQDVRSSSYQVEDEPEVVPEPEVHPEAVPGWIQRSVERHQNQEAKPMAVTPDTLEQVRADILRGQPRGFDPDSLDDIGYRGIIPTDKREADD